MPLRKDKSPTVKARKSSIVDKSRDLTPKQKQQVAELAYQYYLARGAEHGYHLEDWLKAEADFAATLDAGRSKRRRRADVVAISA